MRRISGGWLISSSGSQAVNAAAGMLTNVAYARNLPLDQVGLIALVNAIGMFSTVFVDRGIGAWMTRTLAAGEVTYRNTLVIVVRAGAPALSVLAAVAVLISSLGSMLPAGWSMVGVYSVLFIVSFWVFQVGLSCTQGLNLSGLRSVGVVLNGALTLGGTVIVFALGGGLNGALIATITAYLAVGLLLIGRSAASTNKPISHQRPVSPRRATRSARALFYSNVVTYAVSSGDVLIASALFSQSQVGQYQIAKKVAQATVLPLLATLPVALGKISARTEESRRKFISHFIVISVLGFSTLLLVGSFALPPLMPLLFGNQYGSITLLTLILACAYQFQFLRDLLSVYSNSRGIYKRSLTVNLSTAIVFLALVFALQTKIELDTFALLMAGSFLFGFAVHVFLLRKYDLWEKKRVARLILSTASLPIALTAVEAVPWILRSLWAA